MKPDPSILTINNWIHSDSPGIWRIYRVIHNTKKLRFSPQERQRFDRRWLIFSKRLLDASWKPSFTNEMVNAEFVRPLSEADTQRLESFIAKNPQAVREFEAFKPAPIDMVMNHSLDIPSVEAKDQVRHLLRSVFNDIEERGLTGEEILKRIFNGPLAAYIPKEFDNATLRFFSRDHELRNDEYVFRSVELTMP